MSTGISDEDYVRDGWTDSVKRITARMIQEAMKNGQNPADLGFADYIKAYHLSDDEYTTAVRARTDEVVKDKATADGLKAWYRQYCKRPCFHDEYLETFNRDTVHLVDTEGKGVERVDETGVWANGKHYELDVLIYATGFEFSSSYTSRAALEVYGRNGLALSEAWGEGMKSYQGMHVRDFPNLFIIGIFQGASLISNVTTNFTDAGLTIAAMLKKEEELGAKVIETSAQAQDDWVKLVLSNTNKITGGPECTPGYYNNEGHEEGLKERLNGGRYPHGSHKYFDYIRDWRTNGKFEGIEFDGKLVESLPEVEKLRV
jgi:cyclohexanone monooxygenase